MSQLEAILLGAVQGLTEFLPISSSAHLVAIQHFLGIQEPQLMFDLVLHLGTLSALLFLYGKDLVRLLFSLGPPRWYPGNIQQKIEDAKYVGFLILACIPTGIIGALLGKYSDQLFSSILISGIGLLITGTLLFSTKFMIRGQKPLSAGRAALIGTVQGIAVVPGISRSGSTISAGILSGVDQFSAAKFSFILSIPSIFGASIYEWFRSGQQSGPLGFEAITGFLISFFVGYLSLIFLLRLMAKKHLYRFAYYCWALGIFLLLAYFLSF